MHTPRTTIRRAAFSLTEVMIATGILGVGLIMLASIFPVALSQHRDSYDAASAASFAGNARALIASKLAGLNAQNLWRPVTAPGATPVVPPGRASPWMLLPFQNLSANDSGIIPPYANAGNWDDVDGVRQFAGRPVGVNTYLNGLGLPVTGNISAMLTGKDTLSDKRPPIPNSDPQDASKSADDLAEESPWRMKWYGFYRETADGQVQFAATICRQARGQEFWQQAFSIGSGLPSPYAVAVSESGLRRRFPVPWRITIAYSYDPASVDIGFRNPRILHNDFSSGARIGEAAPPGAKIMIAGWANLVLNSAPTLVIALPDNPQAPLLPAGRILTVVRSGGTRIEVLEDVSDLPNYNVPITVPSIPGDIRATFDVWVFPPDVVNFSPGAGENPFSAKSPVMDWIFF